MRIRLALILVIVVLALAPAGCRRSKNAAKPLDQKGCVTAIVQGARADSEISAIAAQRAHIADTRAFAAEMSREQMEFLQAFGDLAKRKNIPVPPALEERKVALEQNLNILVGQMFDRAYALAMMQDLEAAIADLRKGNDVMDPDARALAQQFLPRLSQRLKAANALLEQLGGTPFQ